MTPKTTKTIQLAGFIALLAAPVLRADGGRVTWTEMWGATDSTAPALAAKRLPAPVKQALRSEVRWARKSARSAAYEVKKATLENYRNSIVSMRNENFEAGVALADRREVAVSAKSGALAGYLAAEKRALEVGKRAARQYLQRNGHLAARRAERLTARFAQTLGPQLAVLFRRKLVEAHRRFGRRMMTFAYAVARRAVEAERERLVAEFRAAELERQQAVFAQKAEAAGHSRYLAAEAQAFEDAQRAVAEETGATEVVEAIDEAAAKAEAEEAAAAAATRRSEFETGGLNNLYGIGVD